MTALTVTVFNPIYDNAQVPPRLVTAPAGADLDKGMPVKMNATTGKFEKMAKTDNPSLFVGLITKDVKSGYMANAFRGLAYMDGLSGLDVGDLVFFSTAGVLADAEGSVNETQTLTISGTPTGGTYTLTFNGATTSALAYNANDATIEAALEALATIGEGNVKVASKVITFQNLLGDQDVPLIVADGASLTGGTDPDAVVAATTAGAWGHALARVVPLHKSGGTFEKMVEIFEMPFRIL